MIDDCLADKGLDRLIGTLLANSRGSNSRFYFHVAMLDKLTSNKTDVASMMAARLPGSLKNYPEFTEACDQSVEQVCAQSGGLLFYDSRLGDRSDDDDDDDDEDKAEQVWGLQQPRHSHTVGLRQEWLTTIAERQRIPLEGRAIEVVKYMDSEIVRFTNTSKSTKATPLGI